MPVIAGRHGLRPRLSRTESGGRHDGEPEAGRVYRSYRFNLFGVLVCGCGAGGHTGQPLQSQVTTEYMLTQAGFTQYKPNMETPKTQALLDALPEGQVTTFRADGIAYHAYPDKRSNVLYVGNQAAYEKYVGHGHGQKLCQRVDAPNSAGFWGCFQEMQQKGVK